MERMPTKVSLAEIGAAAGTAIAFGWMANDSLVTWCLVVLFAGLKLAQTGDNLFVVPAAYMFHWTQTSVGILYKGVLGREVATFYSSNYRPMVWIGLGCCSALAVGIWLGLKAINGARENQERPTLAFSLSSLAVVYIVTVFFEGSLIVVSGQFPTVRQMIVTADTARLGVLYLILRRLLIPRTRWSLFAAVVAIECVLGITGFFAGFREPVVLAGLAVYEIFDRRVTKHWLALAVGVLLAVTLSVLWMGIRAEYRREYTEVDAFAASRSARLHEVSSLGAAFFGNDMESLVASTDKLVDRLWAVYYQSLAIQRVPTLLAHTHGTFITDALLHAVTPRVLFPDKPPVQSDSEKVRKYSGVAVAGADQNTSIAFGYAAESYIDFGLPFMFVPIFVFGLVLGALYRLFARIIRHHELFVAFATITFWLSIYLFERSWATMLGGTMSLMIYLGLPVLLLDRTLLVRFARQQRDAQGLLYDAH
jgi:hypothetical protein